jgi:PKD repeat protein
MKTHHRLILILLAATLALSAFLPGCDKLVTEVNNITVYDTTIGKQCQACHTDKNDKFIVIPRAQWANSRHSSARLLETPVLLDGRLQTATACAAACHSGNGYVTSILGGSAADTTQPSAINCFTCHLPHTIPNDPASIDSLRGASLAVTLANDAKYIWGKSNMCANCHRATNPPPSGTTDVTLDSHFGPHFGAQADVFNGTAGFRFDTGVVVTSHTLFRFPNGCINCHYGKGQGYDFGEHTFRMQYHDAEHDTTPYTANCSKGAGCHTAKVVSNFFDIDSATSSVPRGDSIMFYGDTLRRLLESSYVLDPADTTGRMFRTGDIVPALAAKVTYNYLLYRLDGSRGIHQPRLINTLLRESFERWDSIPPRADFAVGDSDVCTGDPVQFTNRARFGYSSLLWTFGDTDTSTATNPSHAYAQSGVYQVALAATGLAGTSTATKPTAVTVHGPITAVVGVGETTVCRNTPISFFDSSAGIPTSWRWDFGGGETALVKNPQIQFDTAGTYVIDVKLVATNACTPGGDSVTRTVTINVDSNAVANFAITDTAGLLDTTVLVGDTVHFSDSSRWARTYLWKFGDVSTDSSMVPSPVRVFATVGTWDVTMKVTNACGSATKVRKVYVTASMTAPSIGPPRTEKKR